MMRLDRIYGHSLLPTLLGPSALIVDAGANRGEFASRVRTRFGCRVVCIEANPVLAMELQRVRGLECVAGALVGTQRSVRFHLNANSECSSITETRPSQVNTVEVAGVTWSDIIQRCGPSIDLLKLDIEGAELEVIHENANELAQSVRQMTVEFHEDLCSSGSIRSAITELTRVGFTYRRVSVRHYGDVLFVNRNTLSRSLLGLRLSLARLRLWGQLCGQRIAGVRIE